MKDVLFILHPEKSPKGILKMKLTLTEEQKKQIIQALITAVITLVFAVLGILGYNVGIKPAMDAQANQGQIGAQSATGSALYPVRFKQATVTDALYANGTLDVTGAQANASTLTVTGAVTTSATFSVGSLMRYAPGTAISVTNGITNLTPLATYQPLTSSGNVTVTTLITATAFTQGQVVKLINTNSSGNIVLTNGTYLILPSASNLTLGPNDVLELWFDGSKWIAVSNSNN